MLAAKHTGRQTFKKRLRLQIVGHKSSGLLRRLQSRFVLTKL
jgi:hypothetical protein